MTLPKHWLYRQKQPDQKKRDSFHSALIQELHHAFPAEQSQRVKPTAFLSTILMQRGFTNDTISDAAAFLEPFSNPMHYSWKLHHNPFLMHDMHKGVQRINAALNAHERICIFGDRDADGIMATSVLYITISRIIQSSPSKARISYYIPTIDEPYGLSADFINRHSSDYDLIITVDNGITAHDACTAARNAGVDVIITDHHEPGETLPAAYAIIDPKQHTCTYPFKKAAGVGIAFQTALALNIERYIPEKNEIINPTQNGSAEKADALFRQLLSAQKRAKLRRFILRFAPEVTIGTIADMMPLVDENRSMVRIGLAVMNDIIQYPARYHDRIGLYKLISFINQYNMQNGQPLRAQDVSWRMAPRINAMGRVSTTVDSVVQLMITQSPEEADTIIHELESTNEQRKTDERNHTEAIIAEQITTAFLDRWKVAVVARAMPSGITGLIANRLKEQYNRPVIVFALNEEYATGSMRSFEGFSCSKILPQLADMLERYGGHEYAAGMEIRVDAIDTFRERINHLAQNVLPRVDRNQKMFDIELTDDQLHSITADDLVLLEPTGEGNPPPIAVLHNVTICYNEYHQPAVVGKEQQHLRIPLAADNTRTAHENPIVYALWWGHGNKLPIINRTLTARARIELNYYHGKRSIQFIIEDISDDTD